MEGGHRYRLIRKPFTAAGSARPAAVSPDVDGVVDERPFELPSGRRKPRSLGGSTRAAGRLGEVAIMHLRAGHDDEAGFYATSAASEARQFCRTKDHQQSEPFALFKPHEFARRVV